jgi:leader peptidase (prepilin peptidase) / N-methyltransferase
MRTTPSSTSPPATSPARWMIFARKNFGGVNVTIPHKEAAYRFLAAKHALSDTAQLLQSVNTVVFRPDGSLFGDNTDAPGFLDALKNPSAPPARQKARPAAGLRRRRPRPRPRLRHAGRRLHSRRRCQPRRAPPPAARPAPGRARTPRRRRLPRPRPRRRARLRPHHPGHARRHAPRRSLAAPPESFRQGQLVFDLIYNPAETPLLATAKAAGARTANGLGMLLHQGVRAFRLWTGRKPPVAVLRAALLKRLENPEPLMPLPPEVYWALSAFIFLGGLCIGSFLNVCIWRIPREESIVWPGSHCPACNHAIAPWDNLPLLSWLLLNGKCRHCRAPISPRYFLVELLTGALFAALWLVHGWSVLTPVYLRLHRRSRPGHLHRFRPPHPARPRHPRRHDPRPGSLLRPPRLHGQTERLPALWQSLAASPSATASSGSSPPSAASSSSAKPWAWATGNSSAPSAPASAGRPSSSPSSSPRSPAPLLGLGLIAAGKKELQSKIPYGPHIALAAVLWMLCGPACIALYLAWAAGPVRPAFPVHPGGFP